MASFPLTSNKRNSGPNTKAQQKSEENKARMKELENAPMPPESDDENDDHDCKQARPNGAHVNGDTIEVTKPALLDESVRRRIDLIDKLRALGVDKDVHLPTIAVVGDQSTGKSSVLEALSGVQLPRGTGIVTRCPLELQMKNIRPFGIPWRATISYVKQGNVKIRHNIESPADVGNFIHDAQVTLAGNGNGVCKELITLEVESPGVPNLTLIDLPGIARIAMEDQPADLPEQIKELITSYIKLDKTIILAVVPANVDIATTEALQLARQFDKDGNRTLGVITKPDLVDRGSEQQLIDTIMNKKYQLKKGYVCVRCRGQDALMRGVTLEQAFAAEEKFFATEAHFKECQSQGLLGSRNLAQKLTQELVDHIRVSLPALRKNVRDSLDEVQNKLKRLGKGVPSDPHQRQIQFGEVMNSFSDDVMKLVESRLVTKGNEMRIHNRFRVEFKAFSTNLDRHSPDLAGSKRDEMLATLENEIDEWRGKELPRFLNYDMFQTKVGEYVVNYEMPMNQTLKAVCGITKEVFDILTTRHFHQFPELQQAVKSKIVAIINDAEQSSEKRLEEYLDMEKFTYTQDAFFTGKLDKVIAQRVENERERENRRQGFEVTEPRTRAQAETMYDFIVSYIAIAKKRIADTVPMIVRHELLQKLREKVRAELTLMIMTPNIIDKYCETEAIAVERQANEASYKRLRSALAELDSYPY